MDVSEITSYANEWIEGWSRPDAEHAADAALDIDLPRKKPEVCWKVILEVLDRIDAEPSNRLFQVLAAGPLENLLAAHGDAFIDRVESEAASNSRFALLLGGVWQHNMSSELWSRVQACQREAW
jgi:hypothetical protein